MIEYLREENRLLKERLGGRRIRFTDAERRRLARRACALGRSRCRPVHYSHGTGESPWGYTRIQGVLASLGYDVSCGTIANVPSEHGTDPAPERGKRTSWPTFLKAHWESIASTDFITVEVVTLRGLVTYYVLFVHGGEVHAATGAESAGGAAMVNLPSQPRAGCHRLLISSSR